MRWTACKVCVEQCMCWDGGEPVEVIPASFTDEDVEDAARAMAAYDGDVCFEDDTGHRDAGRKHYRDYARCVLSTYLGEGK